MYTQILNLVKDQLDNNPLVLDEIPANEANAIHREVAEHITDGLKLQVTSPSGAGDLLANLSDGLDPGNATVSSIQAGLATSLNDKFGLSPTAIAAITDAIPGLLQKFADKAADPADESISAHDVMKSISGDQGLTNIL